MGSVHHKRAKVKRNFGIFQNHFVGVRKSLCRNNLEGHGAIGEGKKPVNCLEFRGGSGARGMPAERSGRAETIVAPPLFEELPSCPVVQLSSCPVRQLSSCPVRQLCSVITDELGN